MAIDFDKVCRSCMEENEAMFPIFKPSDDDGLSLADLFNSFTTISASKDDLLPENICSLCYAEIQRTIAFKHKTERCDTQFKQYLQIIGQKKETVAVAEPWESLVQHVKHEPTATPTTTETKKLIEPIVIKMELDPLTSEMRFVNNEDSHYEAAVSADDCSDVDEKPSEDFVRNSYLEYGTVVKTDTTIVDEVKTKTIIKNKTNVKKTVAKTTPKKQTTTDGTDQQSLECPDCKTRFSRFNALQKHIRNQVCILGRLRRDPKTPVNCKNCGAEFSKINHLNRHINTRVCQNKLKKVREYQCAHCPAIFTRREKITRHFTTHGFLPKYPCVYCRREYDKAYMKEHIRLKHTDTLELEHLCQVCGKAFSLKNTLRLHMMRHDANKAFKCDVCPFTCVTKTELQGHSSKHTGEHPFECSVCGHRSTTRSARSRHMRIHTGEKKHACEFCPMRFAVPFTLKNHRRTHTGEKPYACDQCDRTFTQRSDCVSHQKTHIVGYLFKCKHCPQSFERHSALKVHTRMHSQMKQERIDDVNAAIATIVSTMQ